MTLDKHYRSLENHDAKTRKDDILRACVSAFVALLRPSKQEIRQTLDLALSILPFTSATTKRFVAAILSASHHAPHELIRRLCDEPVDICAPLLLKSPILSTKDLIEIIEKSHDHAHIISKRDYLPVMVVEAFTSRGHGRVPEPRSQKEVSLTLNEAREHLTFIMHNSVHDIYELPAKNETLPQKLQRFALSDQNALFITLMADVSKLSFSKVENLTRRASSGELSTLLKAFHVEANSAFVICSIFYPKIAANRGEIQLFLTRFNHMNVKNAQDMIAVWQLDDVIVASTTFPDNEEFLHIPRPKTGTLS
jgi:uncharacterized protein (DUF2336 family)